MSKYKEALDYLLNFDEGDNITITIDFVENVEILKKLVNKSIPTKPLHKHQLKQFGVCPICNFNVNIRSHNVSCGNCGQSLNWSKYE